MALVIWNGTALHCELSLISSHALNHRMEVIPSSMIEIASNILLNHSDSNCRVTSWMTTCLCAWQGLRGWLRQSTNTEDAFANEREAAKKGMCTEAWQIVCRSGISMWSQTHVLPPQTGKSLRNSWLHSNGLKLAWWEALKGISFVIVQIRSSQQRS